MAGSAPQLLEDDIEAAAQQPVQDENPPADGDKRSHSGELPELTYEQDLYQCMNSYRRAALGDAYLDFRDLSQINIVHLMNELAKYDQAMRKDKAAPKDMLHVGDLLHRYTTAVQDREYWSRLSKCGDVLGKLFRDVLQARLFHGTYRDWEDVKLVYLGELLRSIPGPIDPVRNILKRVLPESLALTSEAAARRDQIEWLGGEPPKEISSFVDTLARFIVAITGGLSLVIPMLVMRLGETLAKSLTTVSVAVILFSALTSLMFKASNVETLGATAAYAAVLVVFVGTSSSGG